MSRSLIYLISEDWFFLSHFMDRAKAAKEAGFQVHVVTRVGTRGEEIRAAGFNLIHLDMRRASLGPFQLLREIAEVARIYRRTAPDIVHHIALRPIIVGSFAAFLARIGRVVNAPVGMGFVFSSDTIKARLLRPFVVKALKIALHGRRKIAIVENDDDRTELVERKLVKPDKLVVIEGAGVDLNAFPYVKRQDADGIVVMLAARLLKEKGVREFVGAVEILQRECLNCRFVLVGEPDPDNPGKIDDKELKDWQDRNLVDWQGRSNNMTETILQADIFCLPSYREGLPKVLLEAGASGCAIITTDVPGCRQIVTHMQTGLLVPPRDAVFLAGAIRTLVRDGSLRLSLADAARKKVESCFSNKIVNERTLSVYRHMISEDIDNRS
ncbi:glycosyltransferase family 1 protein [Falsochrobactrum shanghaiense]|uniref:Glycosyltransferase family 1 protein n=1 Tax=Falsochrobactrum shanghaiense TaxID=2201899 RepID=A0A316J605_9HYPH|nr:glycosyltransferase family 4 protein [Falsochrobactrum shanghaiense]PWL16259.1 glycosyltransferase family 1 protein [Falsochrobactrum shanghaiense]